MPSTRAGGRGLPAVRPPSTLHRAPVAPAGGRGVRGAAGRWWRARASLRVRRRARWARGDGDGAIRGRGPGDRVGAVFSCVACAWGSAARRARGVAGRRASGARRARRRRRRVWRSPPRERDRLCARSARGAVARSRRRLPGGLSAVSGSTGAPLAGLAVVLALDAAGLVAFAVAGTEPMRVFFYFATFGVLNLLVMYILTNVAAIRLPAGRRRPVEALLPVAGIAVAAYVLYRNVWPVPDHPFNLFPYFVAGWIAIGVVWTIAARSGVTPRAHAGRCSMSIATSAPSLGPSCSASTTPPRRRRAQRGTLRFWGGRGGGLPDRHAAAWRSTRSSGPISGPARPRSTAEASSSTSSSNTRSSTARRCCRRCTSRRPGPTRAPTGCIYAGRRWRGGDAVGPSRPSLPRPLRDPLRAGPSRPAGTLLGVVAVGPAAGVVPQLGPPGPAPIFAGVRLAVTA